MLFASLLSYWSVDSTMTRLDATYYALAMLGLNFVNMMCQHHNSLFVARFGMRVKVATSSLIYRKVRNQCPTRFYSYPKRAFKHA